MKLLLKVMYDGRNFHGFQFQPGKRTVQGTLTDTASGLFGEKIDITGSSRTDAGVHALSFPVTLCPSGTVFGEEHPCRIPPEKLISALNTVLPDDISVSEVMPVKDSFHPRYDVVKKEYIYRIHPSQVPSPFLKGLVTEYKRNPLDDETVEKMDLAAKEFIGEHDFTSFMASGSKITDARRHVFSAGVGRDGDLVVFDVEANGFLYNMVRIMAGTLIDVAEGRKSISDIREITEKKDRSAAGATLPPWGLYLKNVTYPGDIYL